jgi:hypothetical protein
MSSDASNRKNKNKKLAAYQDSSRSAMIPQVSAND